MEVLTQSLCQAEVCRLLGIDRQRCKNLVYQVNHPDFIVIIDPVTSRELAWILRMGGVIHVNVPGVGTVGKVVCGRPAVQNAEYTTARRGAPARSRPDSDISWPLLILPHLLIVTTSFEVYVTLAAASSAILGQLIGWSWILRVFTTVLLVILKALVASFIEYRNLFPADYTPDLAWYLYFLALASLYVPAILMKRAISSDRPDGEAARTPRT